MGRQIRPRQPPAMQHQCRRRPPLTNRSVSFATFKPHSNQRALPAVAPRRESVGAHGGASSTGNAQAPLATCPVPDVAPPHSPYSAHSHQSAQDGCRPQPTQTPIPAGQAPAQVAQYAQVPGRRPPACPPTWTPLLLLPSAGAMQRPAHAMPVKPRGSPDLRVSRCRPLPSRSKPCRGQPTVNPDRCPRCTRNPSDAGSGLQPGVQYTLTASTQAAS